MKRLIKEGGIKKSKHTLIEFIDIIPWKNIEQRMGKGEYKKFLKFMEGQTCTEEGVYAWDFMRFLTNINDDTLYD